MGNYGSVIRKYWRTILTFTPPDTNQNYCEQYLMKSVMTSMPLLQSGTHTPTALSCYSALKADFFAFFYLIEYGKHTF